MGKFPADIQDFGNALREGPGATPRCGLRSGLSCAQGSGSIDIASAEAVIGASDPPRSRTAALSPPG